jgi:autotransporter-associated beta strand protein
MKLRALACSLALAAGPAGGATLPVTNTSDSGAGSLRQAIVDSNAAGGANTVSWGAGSGGTISLASDLPAINGGATLDASNAPSAVTISGAPQVLLGGAVTFLNSSPSQNWTVSAPVGGAGSLVKTGVGTLVLSGANTYSGGTTVNAGTLLVNSNSALGDSAGGLSLQGGTLKTSAAISSGRGVSLSGGGTVDTNGFDSTLSGVVGGTGALTKTGAGVLSLSGANTYSGGTLVSGGSLGVNSSQALGTGALILSGGALRTQGSFSDARAVTLGAAGGTFDTAGATAAFSGVIVGAGSLVKTSSGTLVLSGNNTYSGGTAINGGVLRAASDGNLGDSSGAISFNGGILQTDQAFSSSRGVSLGAQGGSIDTAGFDASFSGAISGAGGLTKLGLGSLVLSGANAYSGGTTVAAGTLKLGADNALPAGGAVAVAAGAVLDLNGFSQTSSLGPVVNGGRLELGSGRVVMDNGCQGSGTLALDLKAATTHLSGKNLALAGTTLVVRTARGNLPSDGQAFTPISDTAGALTGAFAAVVSPAAVSFVPAYSGNGVVLTANWVPFASLAANSNQAAAGTAAESLRLNPAGDAAGVVESLYSLDAAGVRSALDQIGPVSLSAVTALVQAGAQAHSEALRRRASALTEMISSDAAAGAGDFPWGLFATGLSANGRSRACETQSGGSFSQNGAILGADRRLGGRAAAGLEAAFLRGHASIDSGGGTVDADSARAGAYAAFRLGGLRAGAYGSGALDFLSTRRGIDFGGLSRTAAAKPRGREFGAGGDAAYDVDAEDAGTFSPFAALDYGGFEVDGFTEDGAGSLDLRLEPWTSRWMRSDAGLRYSKRSGTEIGDCGISLWAAWRRELMDPLRRIGAAWASGGGDFSVVTGDPDRDGAILGAEIFFDFDGQNGMRLGYSGEFRRHYNAHALSAGLQAKF